MKNFYQLLSLLVLACGSFFSHAQSIAVSSYPSAVPTIYLDFDGQVLEGTIWNSGGTLVCNSANLNDAQITAVYNRVAEDYRPFAVNVTTDSVKYAAAPVDKRIRLLLTTSSSWYGPAGGVAFINSFTWGDNTPCFVFTALLNYNTKAIAEAASHEIGHTLGLRHQSSYDAFCNKISEYNGGIGSGEIGWAPIMGVGYYENMTLWNYGANPYGCTNLQDDLSIVTGNGNGITYRADDYGNALAAAAIVPFINNQFISNGIIERPADADVLKFTVGGYSRLQITALPFAIAAGNIGANIDLELTLLDSLGTIMGIYNPAALLNAAIDTLVAPGTYYLKTQGRGNIYAPDYASLGSYSIAALLTPANPLPLHKLQLTGTVSNKLHQLKWEIVADEKVVSQTLEAAVNSTLFMPVAVVNATEQKASYMPAGAGVIYYRLAVVFNNGNKHYSNTIAMRNTTANSQPYLITNIVSGTLKISSPSAYHYTITDVSGRTVAKGSLAQGLTNLSLEFTGRGLYYIQYSNGSGSYTEKFNKL